MLVKTKTTIETQTTFKHNFKSVSGEIDVPGALGYSKALNEMFLFLKLVTMNGQERYVDALPIISMIAETNNELVQLVKEAEKQLLNKQEETDYPPIGDYRNNNVNQF